ncbi:MAG: hypothetical protein KDK70_01235, partial [Myxococcales bacterium]|nr:hypothetical protein [Myxococcales bacterium]
ADDDVDPSCAPRLGGEDWVYRFTAPEPGVHRFETAESMLDTTVEVLADCEGTSLACSADFEGPLSRADVPLLAGQSIQVVVDALTDQSGAFSLLVSRLDFGGPELCTAVGDALPGCELPGLGLAPAGGSLPCDDSGLLYFDVYELPVAAGECLRVSADDVDPTAGPTGMLAGDLLLVVRDPLGQAALFDDEVPCSDPVYGGFACPQGGAVASVDGVMFVGVAQYGGPACPTGSPYALRIAVDGVDVDLAGLRTHDDLPLDCG